MNKKLKKMLAAVSAVAVCAVSMVSVSAGALYTPTDKVVNENTTSFSATIYGEVINCHLWQEATNYFDDKNIKIYISEKTVNDSGKEYTYEMISNHMNYYDTIAEKWIDYCSVGLFSFNSYFLDNKDDVTNFESYLSDNDIAYEKYEFISGEGAEIVIEQYTETSDGKVQKIYTDDEYFELLQKIKADTGFIVSWLSPASSIEITDVVNELPEPTLLGDTDCDSSVNINDAILVMQSIANPDKYKLTMQGKANADVVGDGDGITNSDALAIQEIAATHEYD
ncbi:MAG: hypothetical protein K2I06_05420 [Ruminococcus sp.]|nr:hypothetical protein [Ruminococcus sp.]